MNEPAEPFTPVPASDTPCTPTESDVLCGRGGGINTHKGNETYRHCVERRKRIYLTARFKREKRLIAEAIVKEIRNQTPPGRFLVREGKDGHWHDIGDIKARDKTSQALRENAPKVRKEMEEENIARREELRKQQELAQREIDDAKRNAEAKAIAEREGHGRGAGNGGWGYHYGPPPPRLMTQQQQHSSSGQLNGQPQPQQQLQPQYQPQPPQQQVQQQQQQQPQQQQPYPPHPPHPTMHQPSGGYPYGLPPQDNKPSPPPSVFDTVTSAFGYAPAQVAAQVAPQPMAPPPSQPQVQAQPQPQLMLSSNNYEIPPAASDIDANDIDKILGSGGSQDDEVDKLMDEMKMDEEDIMALGASPQKVLSGNNVNANSGANQQASVGHQLAPVTPHHQQQQQQLGMQPHPHQPPNAHQGYYPNGSQQHPHQQQPHMHPPHPQYSYNNNPTQQPQEQQQQQQQQQQHRQRQRQASMMDNSSTSSRGHSSAPSSVTPPSASSVSRSGAMDEDGSQSETSSQRRRLRGGPEGNREARHQHIAPIPASLSQHADDKSMSSGLFNIAQHILFSWDNKSTATKGANDGTQQEVNMGGNAGASAAAASNSQHGSHFAQSLAGRSEDEVSEEGQEVELLECYSMDASEEMPPPPPQASSHRRRRLSARSVGSSMRRAKAQMATRDVEGRTPPPATSDLELQKQVGGCHSWFQDSIKQNLPTNVFLGIGPPQSPTDGNSLDDGMEGMSLCGDSVGASLGGQSLVGVFDNDTGSVAGSVNTRSSSRRGSHHKTGQAWMGPPLSPMATGNAGNRNRSETDRSVYSLGTKNSLIDCDHSLISAKSDKQSMGSHHQMSLALSASAESADLGMNGL